MKCPFCEDPESRVVDTRDTGDTIRRRRECLHCKQRFTTYEQVAHSLQVIKSDGRREPFDRAKLLSGMSIACAKRRIAMADLERIVDQIEEALNTMGKAEVRSDVIGGMVLEKLKELDQVAYIRFATVYLNLADLTAVRDEIDHLMGSNTKPGR